jgi:hypothetical protein
LVVIRAPSRYQLSHRDQMPDPRRDCISASYAAHTSRRTASARASPSAIRRATWAIQPACASSIWMIELPPRLVLGP